MARSFNGTDQKMVYGSNLVSDPPFTLAAWFYPNDITSQGTLVSITRYSYGGGSSGDFHSLMAFGNVGGDPVGAHDYDPVTYQTAYSTSGYTAGAWHHACGVWVGNSARYAFLDGGNKGANTSYRRPQFMQNTAIGAVHRDDDPAWYFNGLIAEVGIWNAALSDEEVAVLGLGASPLMVRPAALIWYVPLVGEFSPEIDLINGYNLTLTNAPTKATHPRIVYKPERGGLPGYIGGSPPTPPSRDYWIMSKRKRLILTPQGN